MKKTRFDSWLQQGWQQEFDPERVAECAQFSFGTKQGDYLLSYLIQKYYATVYLGKDSIEGERLNGARIVMQEILGMIDSVKHPEKNKPPKEGETKDVRLMESTLKRTG